MDCKHVQLFIIVDSLHTTERETGIFGTQFTLSTSNVDINGHYSLEMLLVFHRLGTKEN